MANTTVNPAEVEALANAIKQNARDLQPQGANVFCEDWDTASSVLQALQPIISSVPGVGLFAGPAIAIVIAAGNAAKKALCPG